VLYAPRLSHFRCATTTRSARPWLNPSGSALRYGTYLGGIGDSAPYGIAADGVGNVVVAGQTYCSNFPTALPWQGSLSGASNGFVVKLSPATGGLASLLYSSYLGAGNTGATAVALDAAGNAYVTGATDAAPFPTVAGPDGGQDVFVARIAGAVSGHVPWHPHQSVRLSDGLSAEVDLADGHVDVRADDMSIPARGPDLALAHVWDSTIAQGYGATTAGQGWSTPLSRAMGGVLTATVTYTDDTGMAWPFIYQGQATASSPYTAYSAPPGQPWTLATSPITGYTLSNILTGAVMAFDAQGRLQTDTDAYGNRNALTAGTNQPTSETNSGGRALAFTYANGLLADAQSPLWQQGGASQEGSQHVTYGYSGNRLTTLTRGAGTGDALTATFGYSGTQLVTVTTPYTQAPQAWAISYDAVGRVTGITSPSRGQAGQAGYTPAYTTRFTYSSGQTVVVEGDGTSAALTHTYTLDAQGQATQMVDGLGNTTSTSYDSDHNALTSTDANGNTTTNAYQYVGPTGSTGLVTQTVRPPIQAYTPLNGVLAAPTTTYRYDPTTYDLLETDKPEGGVTLDSYDGHHSVVTTTELLAATPGQFCPRAVTLGGTGGCTYAYTWRATVARYDASGERTTAIDGRGLDVSTTQGALGAAGATAPVVTLNSLADQYTRTYGYAAQGDQISASAPPLTTTLNGYTGTLPVVTLDAYDADGNRTAETSANRASALDAYDHVGRQVRTTRPAVSLYNAPLAVTPTVALNSGGSAAGNFGADADYSGGGTYATGAVIDTRGVSSPAPQAVYQSERYGNVGYTIPGLTPGGAYRVRLHFAEIFLSTPGQRVFNVAINGAPVLTNFDIIAVAGAANRAIVEEFVATADSGGQVTVQYTNVVDNAKSSGIEVLPATAIQESTGYDGDGNVARTTDAVGAVTTSSYDPLGRQVATTNPVSGTMLMTYTATEAVATQDMAGNVTRQSYDGAGRLVQASDALTGTTQYGYDAVGNTVAVTAGDSSGVVTQVDTRNYDAQNRVITDTVSGPGSPSLVTGTRYDQDGNVAQTQQPNGDVTYDTYDLADQLTGVEIDPAPVGKGGGVGQPTYESYSYDKAGTLVESVDADNRDHKNTLDGDNRTTRTVDTAYSGPTATTITTTLQYDPDGNTLSQVRQTQGPAGPVQTHTVTNTYNAADWETATSDDGLTTSYGYDAAGQQRSHTIMNGTTPVTSVLDAEGRTTSIAENMGGTGPYTSTFGYNQNDLVTSAGMPGTVQEQAAYDPNSRLTHVGATGPNTGSSATTLNSAYDYGYNAVGWTTGLTWTVNGAMTTTQITHDAQGRVTQWSGQPNGPETWSYDANGNSTRNVEYQLGSLRATTNTYSASAPNEWVQSHTDGLGIEYRTYDANGDTTRITSTDPLTSSYHVDMSLAYDSQARPITVTGLQGGVPITVTMGYNAAGQRARYTVAMSGTATVDERFQYRDGDLAQMAAMTATLNGDGSIKSTGQYTDTYIYGVNSAPLELLRQQSSGTKRYWYVLDGRGNVVALTDVTGAVVDRYAYDPWGEGLPGGTSESVPQPLRYAGYWWDKELGWYWVSVRSYDPEGRWLQPDPSQQDGVRTYAYVYDDPIDFFDPSGLDGAPTPTTTPPPSGTPVPVAAPTPNPSRYTIRGGNANAGHGLYMFLVGDDLSTLNSNANIGFKALAVLDIASNATIFIPVAGEGVEGGKFALKGAFYAGKKLIGKKAIAVSREEAPRIAEQVVKSSNPVEVFERYGSKAEAKASKDANGLVPKPGHERQPKWIGKVGTTQAKTLGKTKNYTHSQGLALLVVVAHLK